MSYLIFLREVVYIANIIFIFLMCTCYSNIFSININKFKKRRIIKSIEEVEQKLSKLYICDYSLIYYNDSIIKYIMIVL